ncbi:hypothetical protein OIU76_020305 [Salix suchowensis]|nr:hypothetical protein OIU76_020305 [Salix suchowensis]
MYKDTALSIPKSSWQIAGAYKSPDNGNWQVKSRAPLTQLKSARLEMADYAIEAAHTVLFDLKLRKQTCKHKMEHASTHFGLRNNTPRPVRRIMVAQAIGQT